MSKTTIFVLSILFAVGAGLFVSKALAQKSDKDASGTNGVINLSVLGTGEKVIPEITSYKVGDKILSETGFQTKKLDLKTQYLDSVKTMKNGLTPGEQGTMKEFLDILNIEQKKGISMSGEGALIDKVINNLK